MQVSTEMVTVVVKKGGSSKDVLVFSFAFDASKWINKQRNPDAYEAVHRAVRKR